MSNKTDRIRIRVFKIWFITLAIVVVVFAEKLSGIRDLPPPFASIFQSFQIMMGLIIPQLATMAVFYFNLDRQSSKIESLSTEQVTVITFLSVAYHCIFMATVIFGIGFYVFDQTADGNSLERNTAAVVAITGLFSVFLTPIAFLFAKPQNGAESVSAEASASERDLPRGHTGAAPDR